MDVLDLFVSMLNIKEQILKLKALLGFAFLQQKQEKYLF